MRACNTANTNCAADYSIVFSYFNAAGTSVSPAFFTYSPASGAITSRLVKIAPTNSSQMGVYTVKVAFTPTNKLTGTSLP